MILGIFVAITSVPAFASASDGCSNRHDHQMKRGASLIQKPGTVLNTQKAPPESPELSAFDRDYILDGNNPLDAADPAQMDGLDKDYISDAPSAGGSDSASAPTASASQSSGTRNQLANAEPSLSPNMDAWERDLMVNGRGGGQDGQVTGGTAGSYDWSSMGNQGSTGACVTREDAQATHVGYTTAPAGTPCVFGVDERDEGKHCIMSGGAYGSLGWCFTSEARDTFGSCSESCPLFGPAKVLGDRIERLDASVREHQAWERWIATSSTSTTTITTTTIMAAGNSTIMAAGNSTA